MNNMPNDPQKSNKKVYKTRRMDRALENLRDRWKAFLRTKYDEWWSNQKPGRENRNIDRFADDLGIEASNMRNYYYKGTLPRDENLNKLARKLGPEVRQFSGNILPEGLLDGNFLDLSSEQREYLDVITKLMSQSNSVDSQSSVLRDDEWQRVIQCINQLVNLVPEEKRSQIDLHSRPAT